MTMELKPEIVESKPFFSVHTHYTVASTEKKLIVLDEIDAWVAAQRKKLASQKCE